MPRFDYERELCDITINFTKMLQNGYKYVPTIWLYKDGQKIIKILARPTDGSPTDRSRAFMELFSSIAVVNPDQALFCADSNYDIVATKLEDGKAEHEKILHERRMKLADTGLCAMYTVVAQRYSKDYVSIHPYLTSNDDRIWWLTVPEFPLQRQSNADSPFVKSDQMLSIMRKMYVLAPEAPLGVEALLGGLSNMGHYVSVASDYDPD